MDFEIIAWPVGLDHDVDEMDDMDDFYSKKKDETRGGIHTWRAKVKNQVALRRSNKKY